MKVELRTTRPKDNSDQTTRTNKISDKDNSATNLKDISAQIMKKNLALGLEDDCLGFLPMERKRSTND